MIGKAPYKAFGQTRNVPIKVYKNGVYQQGIYHWDDEFWIERSEDWYGLMSYPKDKLIRVIERNTWLHSPVI